MKHMVMAWTLALTLPILVGCSGVTLGPQVERDTIWAKMGTPGRVVDARMVDVLVPNVDGKWVRSRACVAGMCLIDEPTLTLYQRAYEDSKKAK